MAPFPDVFAVISAPAARHEEIVESIVSPVIREVRGHTEVGSFFFGRFGKPTTDVRLRVAGEEDWLRGSVLEMLRTRLETARDSGLVEGFEIAHYQREVDRYGGEEGMRIAEEIFTIDTSACVDLIDADARGALRATRREYTMVFVERFLDLMRFDRAQREAFYATGFQWAVELGHWTDEEIRVLDGKWEALRDGVRDRLCGGTSGDPVAAWGGEEPARIGAACLERTRPSVDRLLAAHAAGRIPANLVDLAWSYTHLHSNRLGVMATAEAILRFFMHRFHRDGGSGAA